LRITNPGSSGRAARPGQYDEKINGDLLAIEAFIKEALACKKHRKSEVGLLPEPKNAELAISQVYDISGL